METEILKRINANGQIDLNKTKKDQNSPSTQLNQSKVNDISLREPNGDITFIYTSHEMKFKELENGLK